MSMIARLDHIQLAMASGEEEKARTFWSGLLEMEEDVNPERLASRGGCWFRAGEVIVPLGVEENFVPQRKAHPAFCVENLDGLAEGLASADCLVGWDEAHPNWRFGFIRLIRSETGLNLSRMAMVFEEK